MDIEFVKRFDKILNKLKKDSPDLCIWQYRTTEEIEKIEEGYISAGDNRPPLPLCKCQIIWYPGERTWYYPEGWFDQWDMMHCKRIDFNDPQPLAYAGARE